MSELVKDLMWQRFCDVKLKHNIWPWLTQTTTGLVGPEVDTWRLPTANEGGKIGGGEIRVYIYKHPALNAWYIADSHVDVGVSEDKILAGPFDTAESAVLAMKVMFDL